MEGGHWDMPGHNTHTYTLIQWSSTSNPTLFYSYIFLSVVKRSPMERVNLSSNTYHYKYQCD